MQEEKNGVKKVASYALDPEIFRKVCSYAEKNKVSKSLFVNNVLKEFFEASETLFPESFKEVKGAEIDEIMLKGFDMIDTQLQEILKILEKKGSNNGRKAS